MTTPPPATDQRFYERIHPDTLPAHIEWSTPVADPETLCSVSYGCSLAHGRHVATWPAFGCLWMQLVSSLTGDTWYYQVIEYD